MKYVNQLDNEEDCTWREQLGKQYAHTFCREQLLNYIGRATSSVEKAAKAIDIFYQIKRKGKERRGITENPIDAQHCGKSKKKARGGGSGCNTHSLGNAFSL